MPGRPPAGTRDRAHHAPKRAVGSSRSDRLDRFHYTSGDLLARLEARLREDGFDPTRPTFEALAPHDHFHGRGLEATEDMANLLRISEAGGKPPHRAISLIHGALAEEVMTNTGRALRERRAVPIEVVCRVDDGQVSGWGMESGSTAR